MKSYLTKALSNSKRSFFVLTLFIVSLSPNLYAQWGATHTFNFSLTDTITGLSTIEEFEYLKAKSGNNTLKIKSKAATYLISAGEHDEVTFDSGIIHIDYFTTRQSSNLSLKITRVWEDNEAAFILDIYKLNDNDYCDLFWAEGEKSVNLGFGKNIQHYYYIVPNHKRFGRDITCFVNKKCQPNWTLTKSGETYYAKKYKNTVDRKVFRLRQLADSLIKTRFLENTFNHLFELDCERGIYSRFIPPTCEIKNDSTIYAIEQTYKFKESHRDTSFRLKVFATFQGNQAYFTNHYLHERLYGLGDFTFLTKEEITRYAKNKYPQFDFAKDVNGNIQVNLAYLHKYPISQYPRYDQEPLVHRNPQQQRTDKPEWTGMFAYVFQSNENNGGTSNKYWICRKVMYFYAYTPKLLVEVESCYDLTDE